MFFQLACLFQLSCRILTIELHVQRQRHCYTACRFVGSRRVPKQSGGTHRHLAQHFAGLPQHFEYKRIFVVVRLRVFIDEIKREQGSTFCLRPFGIRTTRFRKFRVQYLFSANRSCFVRFSDRSTVLSGFDSDRINIVDRICWACKKTKHRTCQTFFRHLFFKMYTMNVQHHFTVLKEERRK
jgi:hypothetical protein